MRLTGVRMKPNYTNYKVGREEACSVRSICNAKAACPAQLDSSRAGPIDPQAD